MAFLDLIVSAEVRRVHHVNAAVTPEGKDLAAVMYETVGQVCSQPPALCDLGILGVRPSGPVVFIVCLWRLFLSS